MTDCVPCECLFGIKPGRKGRAELCRWYSSRGTERGTTRAIAGDPDASKRVCPESSQRLRASRRKIRRMGRFEKPLRTSPNCSFIFAHRLRYEAGRSVVGIVPPIVP
jgi:hypothetical protein